MLLTKSKPFPSSNLDIFKFANITCKSTIRLALAVLALLNGVSCSVRIVSETASDDALADRSFLKTQPCLAPCWYGLEMDKSSTGDITTTLKSLPFVDATSIYLSTSPWLDDNNATVITWDCLHPKWQGCGSAHVSQDKLKQLWMKVGYRLNFQEAVTLLGPPDYIDYGSADPAEGCLVFIDWPLLGIRVYSDGNSVLLCQLIENGTKIPPDTLATKLVYSVSEGFSPEPSICCTRIAWPGFDQSKQP